MSTLTLPIKRKYFELIKSGKKLEEYRDVKDYWTKRIMKDGITKVKLRVGYPKEETPDNTIVVKFKGYEIKRLNTQTYGDKDVYAIDVSEPV